MSRLLEVSGLGISLLRDGQWIAPVSDVSFGVERGEIFGIAGESGSGKSLTLRSLVGLLPATAKVRGSRRFANDGGQLTEYDPATVRGGGVSMVFQEPQSALNPTMRIGDLISLVPRRREGLRRREARQRAIGLMEDVGIPDASRVARMWPHELSGGLRQRAMIAAALSARPRLLLCDEPTTALDVSVQDQILGLLEDLRRRHGMSVVFVSHDLAVIGEICDRIAIMYAGRILELGSTADILERTAHPYTAALLGSIPPLDRADPDLQGIPGRPPDPAEDLVGCPFAPRCQYVRDDCVTTPFSIRRAQGHDTACIHPDVLEADQQGGGTGAH